MLSNESYIREPDPAYVLNCPCCDEDRLVPVTGNESGSPDVIEFRCPGCHTKIELNVSENHLYIISTGGLSVKRKCTVYVSSLNWIESHVKRIVNVRY